MYRGNKGRTRAHFSFKVSEKCALSSDCLASTKEESEISSGSSVVRTASYSVPAAPSDPSTPSSNRNAENTVGRGTRSQKTVGMVRGKTCFDVRFRPQAVWMDSQNSSLHLASHPKLEGTTITALQLVPLHLFRSQSIPQRYQKVFAKRSNRWSRVGGR
jgi:hypothetical protein